MLYTHNGNIFGDKDLSVIGLGCWNFGAQWNNKVAENVAVDIIRYAIDGGVNIVDTAESYGFPDGQCEMILGKALKDGYRDKVCLVSKIGWYGRRSVDHFSAKDSLSYIIGKKLFNKLYRFKSVDFNHRTPELLRLCGQACCGRLQTDYIDLLLCHDGNPKDMESFISAFRILKSEGFIKHYGISTDSLDVLKKFYTESEGECSACECDYSLLNRSAENGIFPFCKEHDITILTRGSLYRGLLSGKYDLSTVFQESSRMEWNVGEKSRQTYEWAIDRVNKLKTVLGKDSLSENAYRFVFTNPVCPSVIMGCTSMEQIKVNIRIASSYLEPSLFEKLSGIRV